MSITLNTINALSAQLRHMDIIEEQLFDAQDQLKRQRKELEEIMQQIDNDHEIDWIRYRLGMNKSAQPKENR